MLLYSFNTLFTEKKIIMKLFNLFFANKIILSWFFHFFLIIDLYFLIPTVISKIFNPIADLVIPMGIPAKEAKAEIET